MIPSPIATGIDGTATAAIKGNAGPINVAAKVVLAIPIKANLCMLVVNKVGEDKSSLLREIE